MTDPTEREDVIFRHLAHHLLRDLRCAVVTPSKEAWLKYNVVGPYRFGWAPPTSPSELAPGLKLIAFCPELIAAVTAHLDDRDLDVYLTVTEAFIDGCLAWPNLSADEAHREVWARLYRYAPNDLNLVSEAEFRALDNGTVQAGPSSS